MKLGFTVATPETLLLHAGQDGVVIAIKPQSRFFINWINSIQEAIDWIRTLPHQPTLLFDSYHAMLSERSIYASLIYAYPYLSWVHVSDSNAGRRVGTHRFG